MLKLLSLVNLFAAMLIIANYVGSMVTSGTDIAPVRGPLIGKHWPKVINEDGIIRSYVVTGRPCLV